jgi:hypothetical protein
MKYVLLYRIARATSDFGGRVSIFKETVDMEIVFTRMQEIIDEHDKNTCNGRRGEIPKHAQFFPLKKLECDYTI